MSLSREQALEVLALPPRTKLAPIAEGYGVSLDLIRHVRRRCRWMLNEGKALPATPRVLYRFKEVMFTDSKIVLVKHEHPVISATPTGVWIDVLGRKRFVKLNARKRYACPTEAEALESFRARKRRQIRILKHNLAAAEAALWLDVTNPFEYLDI